ncbi:MAG: hypothetical protein AB8I08_03800 [Sandaracinaceae bacterium]
MAINLDDIYGDGHALVDPAEAAGGSFLQDEDEVRAVLGRLLSEPGPQGDQLRRMAFEDALFEVPLHPSADVSDSAIVDCLTDACMQGRVALVRTRKAGGGASRPRTDEEEVVQEDANLPCDFEIVVLKCQHMPSAPEDGKRTLTDIRFWKEAGSDKNNLPTPRPERAGTKELEVVAGYKDEDADEITIELEGGPGYHCGKSHPHVKVTKAGAVVLEKRGETAVKFKALAPDATSGNSGNEALDKYLKRFYFTNSKQNVYTVDIGACGRLPSGDPGHGRRQVKVRVYPKEVYKLSLSIPALSTSASTRGGGMRLQEEGDAPDVRALNRYTENSSGSAWRGEAVTEGREEVRRVDGAGDVIGRSSTDTYGLQTQDGHLREDVERVIDADSNASDPLDRPIVERAPMQTVPEQVRASLTFSRDGEALPMDGQIGKLVNQLVNIKRTINSVANFIKDFQPQIGWKFVFSVELFAGNLDFEWAHKEWEDHTVYDWWKLSIGMTFFKVVFDLSFGISLKARWSTVEIKVFGVVSVDAKANFNLDSDVDGLHFEEPVTSEMKGELGIRAVLGNEWATAEGKITAGFDFAAQLKVSDGPVRIDWQVDRKKVEPSIRASAWPFGSFERKWEWSPEEKKWMSGVFPGGDTQQKPTPGANRPIRSQLTRGQRRKLARTGRL